MRAAEKLDIDIGEGTDTRRIAVLRRTGAGPGIVWLGGFNSDMAGTKASALDAWAAENGLAAIRFDYSGHGSSGGAFTDGTIGRWLEEAEAVVKRFAEGPAVLVGSSMGGWIALLLALRLKGTGQAPAGLVLIAPAADFTERLMWDEFPPEVKGEIMEKGLWLRPSPYEDGDYPITRVLIEEGRSHLLLDRPVLEIGCPIHILHGREDSEVPLSVSFDLVSALASDDVSLSIIHDGDHRLSRPGDIEFLIRAVAAMAAGSHVPSPTAYSASSPAR